MHFSKTFTEATILFLVLAHFSPSSVFRNYFRLILSMSPQYTATIEVIWKLTIPKVLKGCFDLDINVHLILNSLLRPNNIGLNFCGFIRYIKLGVTQ